MLPPSYLEQAPDTLVELFSLVERDILTDMARRVATYDYFIPAAQHQLRVLEEMGNSQEAVLSCLAKRMGKTERELQSMFSVAAQAAVQADAAVYRRAGQKPPKLTESERLQKVLTAGMKQTGETFQNLTRSTARGVYQQLGQALDRAWMQVASGAFDANTAIRSAVKWLSAQGIQTVDYDSGRTSTLEAAVRRAVVTGLNQTTLKIQEELADEMGCDLVEVTAHSGARPDHAKWQGKIFSRSGRSDKYPDFKRSTGYGTGAGLGGWNCRHSFFPYFEGNPRTYTAKELKKLDAKTITYNGQHMTEYEAIQTQRSIERNIRRWKRERAAMQAAHLPDDQAAAKVKEWQGKQRDFIHQTGLKRQYDREQIAGGNGLALTQKHDTIKKNGTTNKALPHLQAIHAQSWYETIQQTDKQALDFVLEQATDGEIRFWNVYGDLVQGDFYDHTAGGYYSPTEKRVHLNLASTDLRSERIGQKTNCRLFFHEVGHLFDFNVLPDTHISDQLDELRDKLEADATAYANTLFEKQGLKPVKRLKNLEAEHKQALQQDLLEDMHLKNAISDLFEAISSGQVSGAYGHGKQYWKREKALEREAVAHLFEAKMMKGERKDVFTQYFPQTFAYFEEYMTYLEV